MGNTLEKVVDSNDYKEYTYSDDCDILRKTQDLLGMSSEDKLLLKITQISAKCDYEGGFVTPPICTAITAYKKAITPYVGRRMSSYTIHGERKMKKYELENKFIDTIFSNEDFNRAYILEEEKVVIWIVINDYKFKYKKVYLKSAREFKERNNCDFDIVIFDKKQLLHIEEQLKYMGECEVRIR